ANLSSGGPWTSLNLAGSAAGGKRPHAVTYGYHNGSATSGRIILAAVEGDGVYRYFNGSWSRSTGVSIGGTVRSSFVWPNRSNSGVVYLLDMAAGLYRSTNGGQSWTN